MAHTRKICQRTVTYALRSLNGPSNNINSFRFLNLANCKSNNTNKENARSQSLSTQSTFAEASRMPMLQPSHKAPEFSGKAVINGEIKHISLSDYKGKYVVLLFYPADYTFVCPTEIIAFSERADEFKREECEVIAISTDSEYTHLAWTKTPRESGGLGKMNIPLLADKNHSISTNYGILKADEGIAFRGLFIIDGMGFLRQITMNDLPVGRDVDETIRLVQAYKFTDEHGEVCPAGWRKGKKSMKPTQEGVSNYLASLN